MKMGKPSMRHVLVVDDDIAVSEVMRMGLEADGTCRVTCAASAKEALAVALGDRPDAAIVDAIMPGVHGLALARTLIGIGIPVMIISGAPELQRRLAAAGASCPSPFASPKSPWRCGSSSTMHRVAPRSSRRASSASAMPNPNSHMSSSSRGGSPRTPARLAPDDGARSRSP